MIKTYIDLLFKKYAPNVLSQKIKHIFKDEFKLNKLISITTFLPEGISISERVYYVYNGISSEILCRGCTNGVKFKSIFKGHKSFCSKGCRESFGMDRVAKEWWESLDGVGKDEYVNHYKSCYRDSFKEKYGLDVDNASLVPELRRKAEQTNLERFGDIYPARTKIIQDKMKATNLERYGFECSMSNPIVRQKALKSNYRSKIYDYGGIEIITQGYTPHLLDLFKENNIDRSLFKVEWECGRYEYIFNNKVRQYLPDIEYSNVVMEVKSTYTLLNDKDFTINISKALSVLDKGLSFYFIVYDFRKNKNYVINLYKGVGNDILDIFKVGGYKIYNFNIINSFNKIKKLFKIKI